MGRPSRVAVLAAVLLSHAASAIAAPAAPPQPPAPSAPATPPQRPAPASGGAPAGAPPAPERFDLRSAIFSKLEYDQEYFRLILRLQAEGRTHPALDAEGFATEVARARLYVPVLARIFGERARYDAGEPLSLPGIEEPLRVYRNLVVLLDMEQATQAGKPQAVVELGNQAVVRSARDLGVVRTDDTRYYLNLYREFFFAMAQAYYRLGRDGDAVAWLARLEGEAQLQELRKKLSADAQAVDRRAERLALLRVRPVAVMPLDALDGNDADASWLGGAMAEAMANDLVQNTELLVVERSQTQKLLHEAWMSKAGLTDARTAQRMGEMLSASSLLVGAWRREGGKIAVTLRLTDTEDGRVLASMEREGPQDQPMPAARAALLALLESVGFLSEQGAAAVKSARLPTADGLRELLQARLALSRDPERARELYASAARKDPSLARAFTDLRKQFADVTQVVALTPFANITGRQEDLWMVAGAQETLAADLPRLGFSIAERVQLSALLKQVQLGQLVDADLARQAAQKLDADFVVVGSIMHQAPRVRIECRFVEVRTALVVSSAMAEGAEGDLGGVIDALTREIARRFNERLSEKTLSELMGHKLTPEAFQRFARQELARENARRLQIAKEPPPPPPPPPPAPSRPAFWPGVTGILAGAGLAAGGFTLAAQHRNNATYSQALLALATRPEDQLRLASDRDREQRASQRYTAVGIGGAGLAAVSAGYLVWRELRGPSPRPPPVSAFALPLPGGALAGLTFAQ